MPPKSEQKNMARNIIVNTKSTGVNIVIAFI